MSNPTYFIQSCPTCGRKLQIKVEYLGKRLVCQHCQGKLVAVASQASECAALSDSGFDLLAKADELLERGPRSLAGVGGPQI